MTTAFSAEFDSNLIPDYSNLVGYVVFDSGKFVMVLRTTYNELKLFAFSPELKLLDTSILKFESGISASLHTGTNGLHLIHVSKTKIIHNKNKTSYYQGYISAWFTFELIGDKLKVKKESRENHSDIFKVSSLLHDNTTYWASLKICPQINNSGDYDGFKTQIGFSKSSKNLPEFIFLDTEYKSIAATFDFLVNNDHIQLFAPTNYGTKISYFSINILNKALASFDYQPQLSKKYDTVGALHILKSQTPIILWSTTNQESNNADRTIFFAKAPINETTFSQQRLLASKELNFPHYVITSTEEDILVLSSCGYGKARHFNRTILTKEGFAVESIDKAENLIPFFCINSLRKEYLVANFGKTTKLSILNIS